jgi:hypothetical protein
VAYIKTQRRQRSLCRGRPGERKDSGPGFQESRRYMAALSGVDLAEFRQWHYERIIIRKDRLREYLRMDPPIGGVASRMVTGRYFRYVDFVIRSVP